MKQVLEFLFGGNMIEGTIKAFAWIFVGCVIMAATV